MYRRFKKASWGPGVGFFLSRYTARNNDKIAVNNLLLWSKLKQENKIGTYVLCILIKMMSPQFSSRCGGRQKKEKKNKIMW